MAGRLKRRSLRMRAIDPLDGDGYLRMLEHSKALFDAGFTNLADQPFHNPLTMVGQIPRLVQLGSYRTVWEFVSKYFHSPKIRQALSIQPLLVGGSPFDTTSIYGLIHYLERKWGVFYAEGGTGAIVAALGKLMEEEGVNIRLKTTVESIVIEGGAATGVRLTDGTVVPADIVVSDADPMHLFGDMIPARDQGMSARLKRKTARLSMGLFLLYFGTERQYSDVARHTIWLASATRGCWTTSSGESCWLRTSRSTSTGRPQPTRASHPQAATPFTSFALCPTFSWPTSIGKRRLPSSEIASSPAWSARFCRALAKPSGAKS